MKRYSFSEKAVKAMLVTALAFTPVASFGVVQTQAAGGTVVAAYTIDDLITRLDNIYTELQKDTAGLAYVQTTKANVQATEWDKYDVSKLVVEADNEEKVVELLEGIVKIAISSDKVELKSNIEDLEAKYRSQADPLFGKDITIADVQALIAVIEAEYLDRIEDLNTGDLTEETLNNTLKEAILWGMMEAENLELIFDLSKVLKIEEVKTEILTLITQIDPEAKARIAFAKAVKNVESPSGEDSGGGTPTPIPEIEPGKVTPPAGSTEVVRQTNSLDAVEVVTKILKTKITDIVNQITTEKNIVALKLEKTAAGEKALAEIPGSLFTEAFKKNPKAVIEVKSEEASYRISAKEINTSIAALAAKLGVPASEVKITIGVNVVAGASNNLNTVSDVIEFTVKATAGNQEVVVAASTVNAAAYKEEVLSTFGSYAEGDIVGEKVFDANHSTAVRLNADGTFSAVPTLFDGKTATFKTLVNGEYTIVENDKTFIDVDNGKSWAEAHIEKLASKYVIKGKSDTLYAPKADITRGEFALLISRSLGLVAQNPNSSKFPDVQANKGLNVDNEITAAYEAGFIKGFPDGTFRPNDKITRADASVIIARALEFTNVPDSKFDTTKKVTNLKDNASFRYAKDSIEKVYQAGIVEGHETGKFGATEFTTREQMAKVIDKFLQVSNFIN